MAERCLGGATMARSNTKQAWLPRDCGILDNLVGTACGFVVRHPASHGQSRLFLHPGDRSSSNRWCAEQIMPASRRWPGKRPTPSCAGRHLRRLESALERCWMRPHGLPASSWVTASMPLIELRSSSATVPAPPTWTPPRRAAGRPSPLAGGAWQRGARQCQILALLGERSLHLQEGERDALLTMSRALALTASHTPGDDLLNWRCPTLRPHLKAVPGRTALPLLLCADGRLRDQTLRVSHHRIRGRSPGSSPSPPSTCCLPPAGAAGAARRAHLTLTQNGHRAAEAHLGGPRS